MISRARPSAGSRVVEYALVAGIFLGSLALWIVVPFGSLWIASRLSNDATTVVLSVLIICPLAMLVFGLMLGALNRMYLRMTGGGLTRNKSAWLGSLSGGRDRPRRPRSPLETSLTISAGTAVVLLLVWFLFLAESYSPAGFVP
jgi:hypothetical protein